MSFVEIEKRGLVLLGCGKMGSAMLRGWLARGVSPGAVTVRDPAPAEWLAEAGIAVNTPFPEKPAVVLIAVKPQMMQEALPALREVAGAETLFVSVAAGTPIAAYEAALGADAPIVRAMPNTPSAIGKGITAIIGNAQTTPDHLGLAEGLLSAVGEVVRLDSEAQMDAVTGLSGSGPAYVFHLIETLAAAGEAEGLAPDLAMTLAKATVAGAGALAMEADEDPATLRANVTSPNGTTAAGLAVLMAEEGGLPPLVRATVKAAAARSRELADG